MKALGADVLALDWRAPFAETWDALGVPALQGNLDPIILCADWPAVEKQARAFMASVGRRPGLSLTWAMALSRRPPWTTLSAWWSWFKATSCPNSGRARWIGLGERRSS